MTNGGQTPWSTTNFSAALQFNCSAQAHKPPGCSEYVGIVPFGYNITVWIGALDYLTGFNCNYTIRGYTYIQDNTASYCLQSNSTGFVIME